MGMDGDYDVTLDFAPDDNRPNPLDPSIIIAAMRNRLGLTVRAQRASEDFFVIENVEKVAAGNERQGRSFHLN